MSQKYIPYGLHEIDDDDIRAVIDVLKSDWITGGKKIEEFEMAMCEYIGCRYAIVVNSGTSALDIAVASLNLKDGEIITTPFTFVATSNAILYNNLVPVFVDIKKDTHNIDPEEIKKKITNKTKAIIYVDYAGQACDIERIRQIAKERNLYLIEDACHALGAEYKGVKVGNFADITILSFHPVKHITTGEGGMCLTNNEELADRMRLLRSHGIDKVAMERIGKEASYAYDMKLLGRNYRITDFQAALGISQLGKIEKSIEKRTKLASIYDASFSSMDLVQAPVLKDNLRHARHLYTVLLDDSINRDRFFECMRAKNIGVNVHYIPTYKHSYYVNNFNFNPADFPVTEDVFKRIITLPLYPKMEINDIEMVVQVIRDVLVMAQ